MPSRWPCCSPAPPRSSRRWVRPGGLTSLTDVTASDNRVTANGLGDNGGFDVLNVAGCVGLGPSDKVDPVIGLGALTDTGQPGGVHRLPQPGSPALDAASAAACPALSSLCLGAPAPEVTVDIATDATPTFGVFVNASEAVPFDAAFNRVFVFFKDAGGAIRGGTSVAVRTL